MRNDATFTPWAAAVASKPPPPFLYAFTASSFCLSVYLIIPFP
ncbi:hypothetical protein APY03_7546 [Variovorax sp. WDL1]|nr:hypothetical protein APY03_7546 [Variovorax sp. WDL1]